jgi:hypothetical protein
MFLIRLDYSPARRLLAFFLDLATAAGDILRTVTAPFHFSQCAEAPCVCNWPDGLSSTYTVTGWNTLATCDDCDPSTDPAWDGTLHHIGSGCVWWASDASFDPLSINGAMLDITYTQILLRTTVTPCRWEMYIACGSVSNPTRKMWYGYKIGGATPAGTYTFVGSDCGNTAATLTVS